jgi:predicted enzyme related to lactoylglutathione lyase
MPNLAADDLGRAKAFYVGLFGWQLTDWPLQAGRIVVCLLVIASQEDGNRRAGRTPRSGRPG